MRKSRDPDLLWVFRVNLEDSPRSSRLQQQQQQHQRHQHLSVSSCWWNPSWLNSPVPSTACWRSGTVSSEGCVSSYLRYTATAALKYWHNRTHLTCDSKQPAFCSHTTLHELIPYTAVEHARSEGHSLTHVSQHQISLHLPPQGNICTEAHDLPTVTHWFSCVVDYRRKMFIYFESDAIISESNSCWSTVCVCVCVYRYSPSMAVLMSTPTQ